MKKDIVIIGGGIIGCSIARELAKYNLNITLLEKEDDVASGISKANSGIIHAGYNEKENTLKSKLNIEGNKLYDDLSKDLDFTFKRNGALVLAFNNEELATIKALKNNGERLGIEGLEILTKDDLQQIESNISKKAIGGLLVKTSGIINPYEATIAFAENAALNGVEFKFNSEVIDIKKLHNGYNLLLKDGSSISTSIVINAAGINSAKLNNLLATKKYNLTAVKGDYLLLDKIAGGIIKKTIFQVPKKDTKGILVTPTVDGNLLLGPTATPSESINDLSISAESILELLTKSGLSIDNIPQNRTLTAFSGLRPHLDSSDFIIEESADNFISLIGIESPGLTAAPAIAIYVKDMLAPKIELVNKTCFISKRKKIVKFTELTLEEKNALIASNPSYGKMVCKCELITEGEIIDSIHRPLGARTVDAVKRRTRATMGGCQGVGCLLPISKIISRELNIELTDVVKNSKGSNVIGFKEV